MHGSWTRFWRYCSMAMPARKAARRALLTRVAYWANKLKLKPRIVRIQRMTRKWGSCSSGGVVTLASDLARQKQSFQDFVVVHELLHLRVRNHGRVFKALIGVHLPDWRSQDHARLIARELSGGEQ